MAKEQNNKKFKGLFSKMECFLGWISALFGCIFLILNLIVFSCLVPINRDNKEFAVKFGTDITNYGTVATYELGVAYSVEGNAWVSENLLNLTDYEAYKQDLTVFEGSYKTYGDAIKKAEQAYNKAVAEEDSDALVNFESAAQAAEAKLIDDITLLGVASGNLSDAYSAFKTALATYNGVLSDESSTDEQITDAKKDFNSSTAKTNFEVLLVELRDYIAEAKTATNYFNFLTDFVTSYDKYWGSIEDFFEDLENGALNDVNNAYPSVLQGIEEYFGDDKAGAIYDLKKYTASYSNAVAAYEINLSNSGLTWSVSPIQSELNRLVITASDLKACQNDLITHIELYCSVINSLPYRLYGLYEYYNRLEETDKFGYFICTQDTRDAVLGKTNFEVCKTAFNNKMDEFEDFALTFDFKEDYLTSDYYNGLVSEANSVLNAFKSFNGAVTDTVSLGSQATEIAKNCQTTINALSMMMLIFNIILAVILGVYSVYLIVMYIKSK